MKYFLSKSSKALLDYLIAFVLFIIFLFVVFAVAGENYSKWLPVFSILIFLLLYRMLYYDFKNIGAAEMKPYSNLHPYPLKGLLMGIAGMIPVALAVLILQILIVKTDVAKTLLNYALKVLIGPVYFIVRYGNGSILSYVIAIAVPAFVSMLGYLAGYHGFSFSRLFERKEQKNYREAKAKSKSPWNPSNIKNKK